MSRRRYIAIVLAVALAFVSATAGYVAFLSGDAAGRRTPGASDDGVTRNGAALLPRRAPKATGGRLPLTGAALEGDARSSTLLPLLFFAASAPAAWSLDPDGWLVDSALAFHTTGSTGWPATGGLQPTPQATLASSGGGGSSPYGTIPTPSFPTGFFGGGGGDDPPFGGGAPSAAPAPNLIPEPSAPLVFAASFAVVAAALRSHLRTKAAPQSRRRSHTA